MKGNKSFFDVIELFEKFRNEIKFIETFEAII